MREYSQLELVPLHDFQQQFKQALIEAGYDSRDKIVNLVQDIKREMAAERQDQSLLQPDVNIQNPVDS